MNAYMWERVDDATKSWHDEGGILVIAPNIDAARQMIKSECPENCEALTKDPDRTWVMSENPSPEIFVFPDAGCC